MILESSLASDVIQVDEGVEGALACGGDAGVPGATHNKSLLRGRGG